MVFTSLSRDFGWGMDITEEQMVRINEMRMGKEYFNIIAGKARMLMALNKSCQLSHHPSFVCLSLEGEMDIGQVIT